MWKQYFYFFFFKKHMNISSEPAYITTLSTWNEINTTSILSPLQKVKKLLQKPKTVSQRTTTVIRSWESNFLLVKQYNKNKWKMHFSWSEYPSKPILLLSIHYRRCKRLHSSIYYFSFHFLLFLQPFGRNSYFCTVFRITLGVQRM